MSSSNNRLPNADRNDAAATRGWWWVVVLLMLVVALGHFNRIAISVAGAERLVLENVIDATRMGWVYTAFLSLYTLAMLPAGWFIDRVGARATLIVLCFGSAVFVAATSAVGLYCQTSMSIWIGLLIVRSLMGLVNSPLHPAAARMVFAHVPQHARSLANGCVTFGACAGISATYYGFGSLMDSFGWPTAFLITGWITLAVAVIWTWGTRSLAPHLPETAKEPVEQSQTGNASIADVLLRPGVICLALSYAAHGYFQYLFFYFVLNIFHSAGSGTNESRGYSTIVTLTMGVGMVVGGWFSDRFGRRIVALLGMLSSGIVFELGVLEGHSQAMFYAFTLSAFLLGVAEASFWTTIVGLGGTRGGFAASVMNTGGNLGGLFSPVAVPWIASLFVPRLQEPDAVRVSLAIAGIVPIVGALFWFGVPKSAE